MLLLALKFGQVPSEDPNKVGKLTFEDPDLADTRMVRAVRAEGEWRYCASFTSYIGGDCDPDPASPCDVRVFVSILRSTSTEETKLCQARKEMDEA